MPRTAAEALARTVARAAVRHHIPAGSAAGLAPEFARLRKALVADENPKLAAERRKVQELEDAARFGRLWAASEVPADYAVGDLTAPPPDVLPPGSVDAYAKACARLLEFSGRPGTVCIIGARGNGKSTLAAATLRAAAWRGRSVWFKQMIDFFIDLESTRNRGANNTSRAVLDRYARADVLVLDEASERGETVWENRMLTYLITRRHQCHQLTILTSNDRLDTLERSLGESIVARAGQRGAVLVCGWPSIRDKMKS